MVLPGEACLPLYLHKIYSKNIYIISKLICIKYKNTVLFCLRKCVTVYIQRAEGTALSRADRIYGFRHVTPM